MWGRVPHLDRRGGQRQSCSHTTHPPSPAGTKMKLTVARLLRMSSWC